MLKLDGITKTHRDGAGSVDVLRSVSLSIEAREFVVVMGPSGSGKTTLVNIASGIELPTFGEVQFGATNIGRANARERARLRRRVIGVVFQDHELDPVLSAAENVALPMQLDGMRGDATSEHVGRALARSNVSDIAHRRPHEMSGGQRQRVAIARAIAGPDKQFLVVDEPTASLDSVAARMIVELFVDLRTQGLGVLMTTHDSRLASYGDRIVVLRDGALVENSGVGWQ